MKKGEKSVWQGFVNALNLPEDSFVPKTRLEILGRNRLTLEGVREILEYSCNTICVSAKEGSVSIEGDDLSIDMYVDKLMMICGNIHSIIFE